MPSNASTALNPGSTALAHTSTTTEPFHVRILIKHAATSKSPSSSNLTSGDHLEVIPLHLTSSLSALHAHILAACNRIMGAAGRNGQTLLVVKDREGKMVRGGGKMCTKIDGVSVMWEPDSRGMESWTYAHEENVHGLLSLLKERRGRNDIVVVEVDV